MEMLPHSAYVFAQHCYESWMGPSWKRYTVGIPFLLGWRRWELNTISCEAINPDVRPGIAVCFEALWPEAELVRFVTVTLRRTASLSGATLHSTRTSMKHS